MVVIFFLDTKVKFRHSLSQSLLYLSVPMSEECNGNTNSSTMFVCIFLRLYKDVTTFFIPALVAACGENDELYLPLPWTGEGGDNNIFA